MQNQTISELYVDDKKSKLASKDILTSEKKNYEKLYTKENVSKSAINELLNRIPNQKKIYLMNILTFVKQIFL